MAKATATCTCGTCGAKFEKEKICRNRTEADNWETWAAGYFDRCPSCYGKEQAEKEKALGLVFDIRVNTGWTRERGEVMLTIIAAGDSYPYKDQLKALGYKYGEDIPASGALGDLIGAMRPRKAWHKHFPATQLEEVITEFESLGGTGRELPSEMDLILAAQVAAPAKERLEAQRAAVDAVKATRPVRPDCYPEGRWNGRVYGRRPGEYNIYVDGKCQYITDEDAQALKTYAAALDDYNERLADASK